MYAYVYLCTSVLCESLFVCLFMLLFAFQAIVEGSVCQWLLHPSLLLPFSLLHDACFSSTNIIFLAFPSQLQTSCGPRYCLLETVRMT